MTSRAANRCFADVHLTVNDKLAAPAQVFGQQGALQVAAQRVLSSKQGKVKVGTQTAELKLFTPESLSDSG